MQGAHERMVGCLMCQALLDRYYKFLFKNKIWPHPEFRHPLLKTLRDYEKELNACLRDAQSNAEFLLQDHVAVNTELGGLNAFTTNIYGEVYISDEDPDVDSDYSF